MRVRQLAVLLNLLRAAVCLPLLLGATVAVAALAHTRGDAENAAVLLGAATSLHRERPGGGPNTAGRDVPAGPFADDPLRPFPVVPCRALSD